MVAAFTNGHIFDVQVPVFSEAVNFLQSAQAFRLDKVFLELSKLFGNPIQKVPAELIRGAQEKK